MALNLATTPEVEIVRLTKALFDAAPGHTYLTNFKAAAATYGMDALAAELIKYAGATTPAALANLIVTNLGLTGTAATNGKAYLEAKLGQAKDLKGMGKVVVDSMNALATLESDPVYGNAAKAFNQQVTNGYNFSTNPANTTTDINQLHAALQVTQAATEAKQGAEQVTLNADNNTVNATLTTIGAGDAFVDPSTADADVLNLAANTSNVTGPFNGLRLVNIETLNIDATGFNNVNNATIFDLMAPQSNIEGVRTITVRGNGVAGDVILQNVRDSVTTIDASALQNNGLQVTGFVPNIGGTNTNTARTITGSNQNDNITGGNGVDTIDGRNGDDTINGANGNDVLIGGGGNDSITSGTGADSIDAGAGLDTVVVSQGNTGGAAVTVRGGPGDDVIIVDGSTGGVDINAQDDNDTVAFIRSTTVTVQALNGGLGGNDTLIVSPSVSPAVAAHILANAADFETFTFTNTFLDAQGLVHIDLNPALNTTFNLSAQTAPLTINTLIAATITGGAGNDTINGSIGNDTINGGGGRDILTGGGGADTFVLAQADFATADRITDFNTTVVNERVLLDLQGVAGAARFLHNAMTMTAVATFAVNGSNPMAVSSRVFSGVNVAAVIAAANMATAVNLAGVYALALTGMTTALTRRLLFITLGDNLATMAGGVFAAGARTIATITRAAGVGANIGAADLFIV